MHAPPSFVGGKFSSMGLIPLMSMTPSSQSFIKPSSLKFELLKILLGFIKMGGNPLRLNPYNVPKYSMTGENMVR